MGRKKLEMKRIEDKSARQVTFTKRRNGLLKKAKELLILCDVDVGAIIFSNRGKLYHYCSTSLSEILQQYQSHDAKGDPAEACATEKHLLLDLIKGLHGKEMMLAGEKVHLQEKVTGRNTNGSTKKVIMDLNNLAVDQITEE